MQEPVLRVHPDSADSRALVRLDSEVVIDDEYFRHRISLLPDYYRRSKKIDKERFLNKLIDEALLYREAKDLKLHERPDYQQRLESLMREVLVGVYLRHLRESRNTKENQRRFYEENKSKFSSPEMVRIAVISVGTEQYAHEIVEKARTGEDFAQLAAIHSIDRRTARGGGDLGFRDRNKLEPEFVDVAFSMKKGEVQDAIKGRDNKYHVIKLIDRKNEQLIEFERIKAKIANDFAKKLSDDEVSRLRSAAKININKELLNDLEY
jgi:parvulin-like peptidyl-prolyl isomerase